MIVDFTIERTLSPKTKTPEDQLKFGVDFTDHMFIMDWTPDLGWHDGRIVPYGPLSMDPATVCFHYAQEMFEGMKAYRTPEGKILLFRPEMNARRSNRTAERLCIPTMDEDLYVEAVKALVSVDADWVPSRPGTSLYIRPFVIADEPFLGVRPSNHYKFMVILSPVGPYYAGGMKPTKIYVEEKYVRAAQGGTGETKCGGNYAASLKAQVEAAAKGYDQILWLDGVNREFVEEIGTSNAFFVIDGEVITAPLEGTILPGITRDSVIRLLEKQGKSASGNCPSTKSTTPPEAAGWTKSLPRAPRRSSAPWACFATRTNAWKSTKGKSAPWPGIFTIPSTAYRPARSPTRWAGPLK